MKPPPPECGRCGELCPDGPALRSITGERLCRGCRDEEEADIAELGDGFVIGLARADGDDVGLARPFLEDRDE